MRAGAQGGAASFFSPCLAHALFVLILLRKWHTERQSSSKGSARVRVYVRERHGRIRDWHIRHLTETHTHTHADAHRRDEDNDDDDTCTWTRPLKTKNSSKEKP